LPSPSAFLSLRCSFSSLRPLLRLPLFRGNWLSKTASADFADRAPPSQAISLSNTSLLPHGELPQPSFPLPGLVFDNETARTGIGEALGSMADAKLKAANNLGEEKV
ncbi:hypothetical protein MMC31_004688, partial [Peltigera leucophlebia]|nr:hypothetical protein [Peltigera leucophlebia]